MSPKYALFALPLVLAACSTEGEVADSAEVPADAATPDLPADSNDAGADVSADAETDTADPGPYAYVPPPSGPVPEALRGNAWRSHFEGDLLPYWTMDAAFGEPAGNFPTYRGMDGAVQQAGSRRPRMLSRQIYVYAMGYLLTGDAALLAHAHDGVRWLLDHGIDKARGGCHEKLDGSGNPAGDGVKTAQDTEYCAMGLGAWFFLTRDPEAEAALLALRDLLFDPATFWDEPAGRIRDATTADLSQEVDVDNDGGWELVAQLDAINAFLLLVQPVLGDEARREQFAADLRRLGQTLVDDFYQDGQFWGVSNKKGQFGSKHADFGHSLKAYWMLLQIDKRLPDHPFAELLAAQLEPAIARAYDDEQGRWAKRPTSATTVEYGCDWWIYAEADQTAATFNLLGHAMTDELARTWGAWPGDWVDNTRPAREVVPSIARDGQWVWGWTDGDTAKCNEWKNGFHSTEHALVGYVLGRHLEDLPVELHFAPVADPGGFVAVPYVFAGDETAREIVGQTTVGGGLELSRVDVSFERIH